MGLAVPDCAPTERQEARSEAAKRMGVTGSGRRVFGNGESILRVGDARRGE